MEHQDLVDKNEESVQSIEKVSNTEVRDKMNEVEGVKSELMLMRARICNLKLVLFKKCKGVIPRDLKLKLKSILMHKSTLVIKRVPMEIVSLKDYSQIWIKIDELAVIVRKMVEFIPGKDKFHKMRRFTNCFLESEVVDFLSEGC
ncbi:hypothetical protein HN51_030921 [Arachis hypogaea]